MASRAMPQEGPSPFPFHLCLSTEMHVRFRGYTVMGSSLRTEIESDYFYVSEVQL